MNDKETARLNFLKFLLNLLDKRLVGDPTICIYNKETKVSLTLQEYIIKKCKELFDAEVIFDY